MDVSVPPEVPRHRVVELGSPVQARRRLSKGEGGMTTGLCAERSARRQVESWQVGVCRSDHLIYEVLLRVLKGYAPKGSKKHRPV